MSLRKKSTVGVAATKLPPPDTPKPKTAHHARRPTRGGGFALPIGQIEGRRLQDIPCHAGLTSVDTARFGFADIVLEPLVPLVRDRAQDNYGPIIVDLDVLPVRHVPRLCICATNTTVPNST